jgi:hypothetical protein
VRQNTNELAENGFCTIARAPSNPLKDTVLYDFSYYFNQGLMSKEEYLNDVYDIKDGYYTKLRILNSQLKTLN